MLKSVGERQLHFGTPVLVVKVDDLDVLHVTWKVRSFIKLLTQSRRCEGRLALVSLWIITSWEAFSKAFPGHGGSKEFS